MMKYAKIKYNDTANAPGISVSVYLQGCERKCPHCFNPETWDFNSGQELTYEILQSIVKGLTANSVERNLCILGGEPLHINNLFTTTTIINIAKQQKPNVKIYIWTGYTIEELLSSNNSRILNILQSIDYLIDGPYIHELRDITLPMRGSSNQRIINMKEFDFSKKI